MFLAICLQLLRVKNTAGNTRLSQAPQHKPPLRPASSSVRCTRSNYHSTMEVGDTSACSPSGMMSRLCSRRPPTSFARHHPRTQPARFPYDRFANRPIPYRFWSGSGQVASVSLLKGQSTFPCCCFLPFDFKSQCLRKTAYNSALPPPNARRQCFPLGGILKKTILRLRWHHHFGHRIRQ